MATTVELRQPGEDPKEAAFGGSGVVTIEIGTIEPSVRVHRDSDGSFVVTVGADADLNVLLPSGISMNGALSRDLQSGQFSAEAGFELRFNHRIALALDEAVDAGGFQTKITFRIGI